MRVLVACEFSGIVRDAFRRHGHDAWSCDIIPCAYCDPAYHIQADVRSVMYDGSWNIMLAFPPCTFLTTAANGRRSPARDLAREQALEFVRELLDAPIERIALENPVGVIGTRIRKSDQLVQPYMFGSPWHKTTLLWLKNLPPLEPTKMVEPVKYAKDGDILYGNLTRAQVRSLTDYGIANAMAEQWGTLETSAPAVNPLAAGAELKQVSGV